MQVLNEVAELLQQMIRNQCVNLATPESGNEVRTARLLCDYLEGPGLDVQVLHPAGMPHRASVVAQILGTDRRQPRVAFLSHTDVVPAGVRGWLREPFSGDDVDGEIWGRGSVDMLNQVACMAVAIKQLAKKSFKPKGTLLFLAVADEEAGGEFGCSFLLQRHLEQVRADVVFTEIGGVQQAGGLLVGCEEKGWTGIDIQVFGTSAHGSMPRAGENALVIAAEVVQRLKEFRGRKATTEGWRMFVRHQGLEKRLTSALLESSQIDDALTQLSPWLGAYADAATRTTISPNIISGGVRRNIIPDLVTIQLDVRLIAGDTVDSIHREIQELLLDFHPYTSTTITGGWPANASSMAGDAWVSMGRAASAVAGPLRLIPAPILAATDGRYYRQLGIPAYGFGLLDSRLTFQEYWSRFHGPNERIDKESLLLSTAVWETLARDLLG